MSLTDPRRCKTPLFRVSFPHVFKPHAFQDQPAKYSVTMLFDKDADLTALRAAANAAAEEKWGKDKNKWPKKMRSPFTDGNEKTDLDGYEGKTVVKASSKTKPGVLGVDKAPVSEEGGEFYAGCYAIATIQAFAYSTMGNSGVSFGLHNLLKRKDGEPFGGKRRAEDDFDDVQSLSEDPSDQPQDDMGF